jgi:hypothetical protein
MKWCIAILFAGQFLLVTPLLLSHVWGQAVVREAQQPPAPSAEQRQMVVGDDQYAISFARYPDEVTVWVRHIGEHDGNSGQLQRSTGGRYQSMDEITRRFSYGWVVIAWHEHVVGERLITTVFWKKGSNVPPKKC